MSNPIPEEEDQSKPKDADKQDQEGLTVVPPQQTENVIPTTTPTTEPPLDVYSSVNPFADQNNQPVYSTENPLMASPQQLQQQQTLSQPLPQEQQQQMSQPQNFQSRSNPQGETPIPKPVDTSNLDSSIISTLIQLTVLYHNKVAILSGQTNNN